MDSIALKSISTAEPYEAYLIPVSRFPIPPEEVKPLDVFLESFVGMALRDWNLLTEVFMQLEQVTGPESRGVFSSNGKVWMPQTGLGVWVDREPPKKWTKEEFRLLAPGDKPRAIMFQVFRVSKSQQARLSARSTMLRFGSVMEILTPLGDGYLAKATPIFKAGIVDPSYTCFPYYVGLMERKTIANATSEHLDRWFEGLTIYIRQSYEDQAVLIASSMPLAKLLEGVGGQRTSTGWRIAV